MTRAKKLPENIQFSFENINSPETIIIQCALNVYLNDEFDGEPVSYTVSISFDKNAVGEYTFGGGLTLIDNHDIAPFDHKQLDERLHSRLNQILENASFTNTESLKDQLNNLLLEYGDNKLSRFYL